MMQDIGVFCRHLRPEGGDPNKVLGTVDVLGAMAECASFASLTQAIKNSPAEQQKTTIRAFLQMEQALLSVMTEADAEVPDASVNAENFTELLLRIEEGNAAHGRAESAAPDAPDEGGG